jgi:hypothetical protein
MLALFACQKDDPEKNGPCNVVNPIQDLEWLRKEIEILSKAPLEDNAYFSTIYKGERVFWLYSSSLAGSYSYRKCDGSKAYVNPLPEDSESKTFVKLLIDPKLSCPYLIWSSSGFQNYKLCN